MEFPLTNDFTTEDCREMLEKIQQLIDTPVQSTIWECFDLHESSANRKYRKYQTA
jgi:hypothetical protein